MYRLPSPVEPFAFAGERYYVKRDDLIHPLYSGNKFRKLHAFFHLPSERIERVYSYGGIQSNAMLSIAALCAEKGWTFDYTAKTVPGHLRRHPMGNFQQALQLDMQLTEVHPMQYDAAVKALQSRFIMPSESSLLIPQGGANTLAHQGIAVLAEEIRAWKTGEGIGLLTVVTPSGTGTTAGYLAAALPECRIVTVAAVGDPAYLQEQIGRLMPLPENLTILPTPYRFGRLHDALLKTYHALKDGGIEFDLLYAPVMWLALADYRKEIDGEVLYVHSGGVGGNETMLARYHRQVSSGSAH